MYMRPMPICLGSAGSFRHLPKPSGNHKLMNTFVTGAGQTIEENIQHINHSVALEGDIGQGAYSQGSALSCTNYTHGHGLKERKEPV